MQRPRLDFESKGASMYRAVRTGAGGGQWTPPPYIFAGQLTLFYLGVGADVPVCFEREKPKQKTLKEEI